MNAPQGSPAAALESRSWAIVGGGMLGLTLAHRLLAQGQRVTVLEAAPEIGGLAGAWQIGDVTWDKHYHVTLLSDLRLRALLDDLGLGDELEWVETRTGFFTDGQLHSMSNSWEFLRFPPLRLIDKVRLAGTIFGASKRRDGRALEQVLVGDWLSKWSGRRTFAKIWEPLLLAKLGPAYRRCSAAFIWATIQRMYSARQAGLKKEMFGYVRGGYARVLAKFAENLQERGADLRTNSPVNAVVAEADGRVRVDGPAGSAHFDRVVLTTPAAHVAAACQQLDPDERARHEGVEYLGVVCASVLLTRPLAGFYVTNITDEGFPFTAVIEMTSLVDPSELGGQHLVYLPRYAATDDAIWNCSDDEIQRDFMTALRRMYPDLQDEHVAAFRVSRARAVMALPTLNYSDRLPPLATAAPYVFAVNSTHITKGTLNVNEIIALVDDALASTLLPSLAPAHSTGVSPAAASDSSSSPRSQSHDKAAGELVARS
ncbi:MAG: NAD(P)/FAD-dependent oxidoreductase [Planctomycetales bacterium]|nr:NAD(P)/FAD-dependent oxidoreductase [Planctomycetales bacterium]